MCIRRVLVLPVKKQEDCLTAVSSLHETVSIISGIKETNRREVFTDKLSTSDHPESSQYLAGYTLCRGGIWFVCQLYVAPGF